MTRKGLRSKFLSIGLGSHLDIHQHNHRISGLVAIKDIQIKLRILMQITILLPLKNQCVLVGSFTLQMLPTDDPLNREDSCWDLNRESKDGRDSVHFMYRNDNSPGYIRMAEGTVAPGLSIENPSIVSYCPIQLNMNNCSYQRMELSWSTARVTTMFLLNTWKLWTIYPLLHQTFWGQDVDTSSHQLSQVALGRYHIWTCCAREGCWFSTWWWSPWLSSNNCNVVFGPGNPSKLW